MTETQALEADLEYAAELINQADSLIVGAGAGMGVDSGLPDFRGNDGFWRAYPALGRAGVEFYSIACPDEFRRNPRRAWGFYGHRLALYRDTEPHDGFEILRRWGLEMPRGYSVFTSNVDGQFQRAGYEQATVREYHGSIHHLQCLETCSSEVWSAESLVPVVDVEACELLSELPTCPHCGALARPNVLMFGDREWSDRRAMVQDHRQESWLSTLERPVVIELGAGSAIPSVRHFSQRMIVERDAKLIRINPASLPWPEA